MSKLLANGLNFHYRQTGEGKDLVLLHGLTGNMAIWYFTLLPQFRSDFRVTMYDLRGHGRSDMPSTGYTTLHMAEDLLGILDALEIEKASLLGHSLGADIAIHFSLLYPDRVDRVIAIEAGIAAFVHLRKDKHWSGWEEWAKGIEEYGGLKIPREKWHDIDYMLRKSLDVPIIFGPARGLPRKKERLLRLLDTTSIVEDYQDVAGMTVDSLAQITHPVQLVYGSQSTYLGSYEILRDTLPNCQAFLAEDSQHFDILTNIETIAGPLCDFLACSDERSLLQQTVP